jgi:hypothetical protein
MATDMQPDRKHYSPMLLESTAGSDIVAIPYDLFACVHVANSYNHIIFWHRGY